MNLFGKVKVINMDISDILRSLAASFADLANEYEVQKIMLILD